MRRLQNVPGHGGGVHPAAQHGYYVGGKDVTQGALFENRAHHVTVNEKEKAAGKFSIADWEKPNPYKSATRKFAQWQLEIENSYTASACGWI
jgi:hypothetical protein